MTVYFQIVYQCLSDLQLHQFGIRYSASSHQHLTVLDFLMFCDYKFITWCFFEVVVYVVVIPEGRDIFLCVS